jgi:hypothetical protein
MLAEAKNNNRASAWVLADIIQIRPNLLPTYMGDLVEAMRLNTEVALALRFVAEANLGMLQGSLQAC